MIDMKNNSFSTMSSFNNYLKTFPKITLLTYGESNLAISPEIKTSLINLLLDDNDKYCHAQGAEEIRTVIIDYENSKMGTSFNKDNILITNGATESLYLIIKTLLKEGDEVILFSPYYPEYKELITINKLKKSIVKLNKNYQIDEKELLKKITKKTKMILINTPSNPTGIILDNESLSIINKIVKKYNLYLIIDQVYDTLAYQNMAYLKQDDINNKVVIVNSLSKSHNLTGWRLGYCIGDVEIINNLAHLKQTMNVCMPLFLQKVIKYVLPIKNDYKKEYRSNINIIYKTLRELDIDVIYPDAGFYLFFNIENFKMDSLSFCIKLATEFNIGLIPGIYFEKDNYVRISCILKHSEMIKINKKLKKALLKIKKEISSIPLVK